MNPLPPDGLPKKNHLTAALLSALTFSTIFSYFINWDFPSF